MSKTIVSPALLMMVVVVSILLLSEHLQVWHESAGLLLHEASGLLLHEPTKLLLLHASAQLLLLLLLLKSIILLVSARLTLVVDRVPLCLPLLDKDVHTHLSYHAWNNVFVAWPAIAIHSIVFVLRCILVANELLGTVRALVSS